MSAYIFLRVCVHACVLEKPGYNHSLIGITISIKDYMHSLAMMMIRTDVAIHTKCFKECRM